MILKIFIVSPYNTDKFKKDTIQYVLITMLSYAIIYLISGLFTGYSKNPYSNNIIGVVVNFYVCATIFVVIEYIRYKLIHNIYKDDEKIIFVMLVILFSIWDFKFFNVISGKMNIYISFKLLFYKLIPILIKNVLFTYTTLKIDYMPAIVYNLLYYSILWMSPVLPDIPWVIESIFNIIFPLILLLHIRYYINKKNRFNLNRISRETNPSTIIPFCILLILLICFALGMFPIKPVGIATGSMYPEIKVGDAVIIRGCTANDVGLQDVIEYQMENYTVIHRVISKYQKDGKMFFITKGDNNQDQDYNPVSEEQLIGKAIFKIPYIAIPAIWLHSINSKQTVEVETGTK